MKQHFPGLVKLPALRAIASLILKKWKNPTPSSLGGVFPVGFRGEGWAENYWVGCCGRNCRVRQTLNIGQFRKKRLI